ncbi:hypothetical protein chiPu_0018657 [Chiloscyllium punctatum]|uniref:MRH domain-containing protein n=1 Tax=Chiloscyllium punctatum TaxID=137246 RepID=A0A401RPB7_CHIPU|nr:hypothetical protein [Chiloscyllium punctatum]
MLENERLNDYHYEYTECDNTGSRWRVAIPKSPGTCTGLPEPIKGRECSFSCGSGEFLELQNQSCSKCAAGSYSLGSGIRFDDWDTMPVGFSTAAAFVDEFGKSITGSDNCKLSSWVPRGRYIASNRDDCTVSLIYSVHLKKSGSVTFDYQYLDNSIFFEFFMNLNTGTNVLYWRTTGIMLGTKITNPVLVKNIHIEGVAYTSECFLCKPGTFSDTAGSSVCKPCPRNMFSGRGASSCQKCDETKQFSEEGSSECKDRPPCTEKDYFQIHTRCDNERKTQIMYKWITPKLCREDMKNAVQLPPSGEKKPCPPCNPGFYNNETSVCAPCPTGTFSDGMSPCKQCPAGTEPTLGFEYKWWNTLPVNMKTSCFNVGNSKCDRMNGWEVAGDHIHSAVGGSDNDYLILNLHIPSFSPPTSSAHSNGMEVGRMTFIFETRCTGDCQLYFMVDHSICFSDCSLRHMLGNRTLTFELSNISGVASFMNGPSFTSRGTKYYHFFNISLCGNEGKKIAICSDNVTDVTVQDVHSDPNELSNSVASFVCQSTIIPSDGRSFRTALSSQSISLADAFLGATVETSIQNITARPEFFPAPTNHLLDIHFFYMSSLSTASCENGRGTVITIRCDPGKDGKGEISVPSGCPGGTCDGCTFLFLWETLQACPLCTSADYHAIEGACKGGLQETTYVWKEPKVCNKGVKLPAKSIANCEMIDFWLKVVVGIGAFTAVLLVILTCYFWKKNKKLEYKYSRLVMNTNSREVELPAADSCAIMEGEDNEDEIVYSNKPSLLGKLKSLTSKDKEDIFESVQLKSPRARNI